MVDLSSYIDVSILVIVYLLIEFAKLKLLKSKKQRSYIPLISATLGSIISAFIFIFFPEVSSSVNLFAAVISGIVSGAAATGSNKIYKTLCKFFTTSEEEAYYDEPIYEEEYIDDDVTYDEEELYTDDEMI